MAEGTKVGEIYYTMTLDTQGLINGERETKRAMDRLDSAGQGLERTMTRVGGAIAAMFAAGSLVAGLRAVTDAAGKFELALDNLQAITGITGDRLKTVEQAAMKFGQTTATSASEAVEAMKLIASAKGELADNEQGLIAVTKAAQTLAEASGMALPAAADSLVTALNQMGVGASQAERYINVMASGAKVGASEVGESSQALKQFATTAASVGVSFESANAAIQGLAKAGIKGSEAGNALKNIMLKLETDADTKLRPSMHGLTGAIEALGAKNLATASLVKMFGLENINAAKALIANTGTIKEFEAAMTGTSVAHEQATINTDNYATAVKKMQAAMDAAAITVGSMLTPALKTGAEAVTAITVEISQGSDRINAVLKLMETAAVIAAGALAGPLVSALAAAAVRAAATASAMGAATVAVNVFNAALAGLGGPVGIAITALALLVLNWDSIAGRAENAAQISERSASRIAGALKKGQMSAESDLSGQLKSAQEDLQKASSHYEQVQKFYAKAPETGRQVIEDARARKEALEQSVKDIQDARNKIGGGGGRGSVNPDPVVPAPESKPKPVDNVAAEKAAKEAKYLADLRVKATQDALAKINMAEQAALSENTAMLAKGEISARTAEQAKGLIARQYAAERKALAEKDMQDEAAARLAMTTDAEAKIAAARDEAMRRADAAEKAGTMTHAQAERERSLATFKAAQERADLAERNAKAVADAAITRTKSTEEQIRLVRDEEIRQAESAYKRGATTFEEAEAAKVKAVENAIERRRQLDESRAQTKITTLQIRADTSDAPQDKEAVIRAQAEAQMAAVDQARSRDLENAQLYADQRLAIEQRMNTQIMELQTATQTAQLTGASSMFGSLASIMQAAAGKQSGIYKAMFAASKAFAIAEAVVKIQQGIASAVALPFPANIPAMASVAAASAGIVQTIAGTNYGGGRQYGGPVSSDTMYRVNETGRPEMFTAANGSQYMLPTSGGRVTPADQVGGGGVQWQIIVNNSAPGAMATASVDSNSRTVTVAVREVAAQITERRGEVWSAMKTTNVQGRPG